MWPLKKSAPEDFKRLLNHADGLASIGNVDGLKDLIKLIMRPIQSKHMMGAYISAENEAPRELEWATDMGIHGYIEAKPEGEFIEERAFVEWCWSDTCLIKDRSLFPTLHLSSDLILPTPWHSQRLIRNLGVIGEGRLKGQFKQEFDNHFVTYQYPLMIGWVTGGNHSITQGIIGGQGEIVPHEVHDISLLVDS